MISPSRQSKNKKYFYNFYTIMSAFYTFLSSLYNCLLIFILLIILLGEVQTFKRRGSAGNFRRGAKSSYVRCAPPRTSPQPALHHSI